MAGVEVMWPAIRRRLHQNGNDSVYLIVKVPGLKGSPEALLADMRSAMALANTASARDGEELVWAQDVIPSMKGPMVDLDWIGTDEETQDWLATFANRLSESGWSGNVTAAPQVFMPQDLDAYWHTRRLVCTVAFTVAERDQYFVEGPGRWLVAPDVTRDLCRFALEWAAVPGATTYLSEATSRVVVDDLRPVEALATGVMRSAQATVFNLLAQPYRARALTFSTEGRVAFNATTAPDGGPLWGWRDQLESAREALVYQCEHADWSLIQHTNGIYPTFGHDYVKRSRPYIDDVLCILNRHLWSEYVPDAYAVQVLTSAHMDKAHDLSDWSVQKVGTDRYLVRANDLEAWWDDPEPAPGLVDQARRNFGDMLMTFALIESDPHGWIPGRGRRQ